MRAHWAGERSGWLGPALRRIDAALAAGDAAVIRAFAPDTDAATADALALVPTEFIDALVLDMTIETSGRERLMIASPPDDGHVYVFALCRVAGEDCRLRRFLLTSLE